MTMEFKTFIERLRKESRFNRRKLQQVYEKGIFSEGAKYAQYERIFQGEWDEWTKDNGTEKVADFFVTKGAKLFRGWLKHFFPFYTSNQRLILAFKRGGSPEDVVIHMFYRFSQEELQIMDQSLIKNISRRTTLTRIFLESFLAMRHIITKVLGYKYTLVVEESQFLEKGHGRILFLELIARPQE